MGTLVAIDGRILAPDQAMVSVFDRGFLFGDSVYETLRTYDGRPFLLDRHLARLARSAAGLDLAIPGGAERLEEEIARLLAATSHGESALRIVVTRGAAPGVVDLDPDSAPEHGTVVLIARPFTPYPPEHHEHGVAVRVVGVLRTHRKSLDPRIKSGNYLNNMLALREARRAGAFECLMPNREGYLTEGSTSNVFLVQGGRLRTPALDCGLLDGITRGLVIELAREAGLAVEEACLGADDLAAADEVFLTSSLKEVMPVASVDGAPVGDGRPGPITRDLLARYRARTRVAPGAR